MLAYRTTFVLDALLQSDRCEEPAYDVYDLVNPAPTCGAERLGKRFPSGIERFAQEVRNAADAKNIRWVRGGRAEVSRILILGDPRFARCACGDKVDAVVSPPLLPRDAATLQEAGCALVEVEDFLELALAHFAERLQAMTQLEVRIRREGFNWRRLRSRDGTIPS